MPDWIRTQIILGKPHDEAFSRHLFQKNQSRSLRFSRLAQRAGRSLSLVREAVDLQLRW
jgi:hypothetical protein